MYNFTFEVFAQNCGALWFLGTVHRKIARSQNCHIDRPIYDIYWILALLKVTGTINKMFIEVMKDYSLSMWTGTVLNESQGIPIDLQDILYRHKFIQNVQINI